MAFNVDYDKDSVSLSGRWFGVGSYKHNIDGGYVGECQLRPGLSLALSMLTGSQRSILRKEGHQVGARVLQHMEGSRESLGHIQASRQ